MQKIRNTIQRQVVLEAVQALHHHPTAADVHRYVAQRHPGVSQATVYRNLNLLAQQGKVLRVSHLDAADRFDFQLHPHYHFRCRACDSVYDVALPYDEQLLEQVPNPDGFLFEHCEITFSGLCDRCRHNHDALND